MARKKKEMPEAPKAEISLSKRWLDKIERAKKKYEKAFNRMKADMKFARMCQEDENDNEYKANFVLRHLNNKTATLYAKNPKIVAERRQKMLFTTWDGDMAAIAEAKEAIAMLQSPQVDPVTGQPGIPPAAMDPQAMSAIAQAQAVLDDYEQGSQKAKMLEKVGKTLAMLLEYYMDECNPRFKVASKQCTRRTITTGIGWLKVGFQRVMGKSPDIDSRIDDAQLQLMNLRELLDDKKEDEWDEDSAKAAELAAMIEKLKAEPDVVLREGLVFSWPKSTKIILDPETTCILGFSGTGWIAEEYLFSQEQVESIYGVKMESGKFSAYGEDGKQLTTPEHNWSDKAAGGDCDTTYALVYEVWDKNTGLCMTVCDGYEGFLESPAAPDVRVERFFPYFPLMFNGIEDDEEIYPPSDIRLMMPMQLEYNRARHGLREHRKANRPGLVCSGNLESKDKDTLSSRPANALVHIQGLAPDQSVQSVLQPIPNAPLDPNLYDVSYVFDDTQRVVGVAEANIGGTSNSTATESSIAESTRQTGVGSNVNDMDEWLSDFAQAAGQILLANMSAEQVRQIVGDGAAWPELTAEDIAKEVWLSIEAGSSGKPNKALEVANMERMMPFLIQMPGMNPKTLLKETLYRMDDRLEVEDFYMDGAPSIAAQNGQSPQGQMGAMMGPQGAMNSAQPAGRGGNPNIGNPAEGQPMGM